MLQHVDCILGKPSLYVHLNDGVKRLCLGLNVPFSHALEQMPCVADVVVSFLIIGIGEAASLGK